jgi:ribosomal protein S18 acetylase RimI-like enzyme
MNQDPHYRLDNPVWYALNEIHSEFSLGNLVVKRYHPSIAPFVAFKPGHEVDFDQLDAWLRHDEVFYFIGDLSVIPSTWTLKKELDCVQMIFEDMKYHETPDVDIKMLSTADSGELYDLIQLVQPGYYVEGSGLMGRYFGIRVGGKLVAVAGERIRFEGYTEVSGICTHPDYTGRHYAHHLTMHVLRQNLEERKHVFLHALRSNIRAIGVYEHLGFKLRRYIPIRALSLQQ